MKNTYFVFSDVHGEYDALLNALMEAGYDLHNPRHILVSLGDNFDRGSQSKNIYELLTRRKDNIWVKGNHEIMLEEAFEKKTDGEFVLFNILHNGLDKTLASFAGMDFSPVISAEQIDKIIDMGRKRLYNLYYKDPLDVLKKLPYYYETKNYIFVHAGLDPIHDWKKSSVDIMTWDIEYSHLPIPTTRKTVVIGHHHAIRVRKNAQDAGYAENALGISYVGNTDDNRPIRIGNKVAIDPCSNLTKKVNVLIIEDEPMGEELSNQSSVQTEPSNFEAHITDEGITINNNRYATRVTIPTYTMNEVFNDVFNLR